MFPGCVIEARPAALVRWMTMASRITKSSLFQPKTPATTTFRTLMTFPQQTLDEIDESLATYKNLELDREVETLGRENKQATHDAIKYVQDLYDEHFGLASQ